MASFEPAQHHVAFKISGAKGSNKNAVNGLYYCKTGKVSGGMPVYKKYAIDGAEERQLEFLPIEEGGIGRWVTWKTENSGKDVEEFGAAYCACAAGLFPDQVAADAWHESLSGYGRWAVGTLAVVAMSEAEKKAEMEKIATAKANAKEHGKSLLASIADAAEVAKILDQTDRDPYVVNFCDQHGNTAINICANYGHLETAKLLVAADCDLKKLSGTGWTPLKLARIYGFTDIVNLLGSAYARAELRALTGASDPRTYSPDSEEARIAAIACMDDVVIECMVPTVLEHAPQFVRADMAFVWRVLYEAPRMCLEARDSNGNPDLNQLALVYPFIDASLLDDEKFVRKAIEAGGEHGEMIFPFCSERLRSMKVLVMNVLERNGNMLAHASTELRADRDVVMLAAQHSALNKFGRSYKALPPILLEWQSVLSAASPSLREDREVITTAVTAYGYELAHVPPHLVDAALIKSVLAASYTLFNMQHCHYGNYERNGKGSLKMLAADSPFRDDEELVRFAIETGANSHEEFAEASPALRNNREVAMLAVSKSWEALQYASEALRDDRELVLCAQSSTGNYAGQAAKYASERLRTDEEIKSRFDAAVKREEDDEYERFMR